MAALGYGTGAVLVLRGSGFNRGGRTRAFTALSVFMAIGTLANGASRSPVGASRVDTGDSGDDGERVAFSHTPGVTRT